jgi:hypothetical protein
MPNQLWAVAAAAAGAAVPAVNAAVPPAAAATHWESESESGVAAVPAGAAAAAGAAVPAVNAAVPPAGAAAAAAADSEQEGPEPPRAKRARLDEDSSMQFENDGAASDLDHDTMNNGAAPAAPPAAAAPAAAPAWRHLVGDQVPPGGLALVAAGAPLPPAIAAAWRNIPQAVALNRRMNTLATMVRDVSFMSGCTLPQTAVAIQSLFQVAADELHQRKSFTVVHSRSDHSRSQSGRSLSLFTITANHSDKTLRIVATQAFERLVFRRAPPAINAYTC